MSITTETTDNQIKSLLRKRATFTINGVESIYPANGRGYLTACTFGSVKISTTAILNKIFGEVFTGGVVTVK